MRVHVPAEGRHEVGPPPHGRHRHLPHQTVPLRRTHREVKITLYILYMNNMGHANISVMKLSTCVALKLHEVHSK